MSDKKGPRLNRYYENLKPYYKLKDIPDGDKTLLFESRFESANLRKVVKIHDFEYDLFLKNVMDFKTELRLITGSAIHILGLQFQLSSLINID